MAYDARFHTFMLLSDLAERLLPNTNQYTKEQADAIHYYSRRIAKELLSGDYVYVEEQPHERT